MAATWTIRKLKYRNDDPSGLAKVVDEIKFTVTDDDAPFPFPSPVGRYEGGVSLHPLDLSNFVDFDSLTEQECLGWAQSVLGAQTVADIEDGIAADVAAQGHPRKGQGVPWED